MVDLTDNMIIGHAHRHVRACTHTHKDTQSVGYRKHLFNH